MAIPKRNSIELVKEVKGEEVETEMFWTPPFIKGAITKEALQLMAKYEAIEEKQNENKKEITANQVLDMIGEMAEFIANRLYDKQFTKKDLEENYPGPEQFFDFKEQVQFAAIGFQNNSTRNFLKSKR